MNAKTLREYLTRLDLELNEQTRLCIYDSAAIMLMGAEDRFSVDMDVAGPYSTANERVSAAAADGIGLPVNPPEDYSGDHIEWVGPERLCLAAPDDKTAVMLWRGGTLAVFTAPPADLVASRLIRYDPTDQSDIQYLLINSRLRFEAVAQAVERLPDAFRSDALVRDNLANLKRDIERWTL